MNENLPHNGNRLERSVRKSDPPQKGVAGFQKNREPALQSQSDQMLAQILKESEANIQIPLSSTPMFTTVHYSETFQLQFHSRQEPNSKAPPSKNQEILRDMPLNQISSPIIILGNETISLPSRLSPIEPNENQLSGVYLDHCYSQNGNEMEIDFDSLDGYYAVMQVEDEGESKNRLVSIDFI